MNENNLLKEISDILKTNNENNQKYHNEMLKVQREIITELTLIKNAVFSINSDLGAIKIDMPYVDNSLINNISNTLGLRLKLGDDINTKLNTIINKL